MKRKTDKHRDAAVVAHELIPEHLFHWFVSSAGYGVARLPCRPNINAMAKETDVVYEMAPWLAVDFAIESRPYSPFLEGGVFRAFAAVDMGDADSVSQFANTFGLLGIQSYLVNLPPPHEKRLAHGEKLGDWRQEHADMRRALELWQGAEDGAESQLRSLVSFVRGAFVYHSPDGSASETLPEELPIDPTDVAGAARYFVQKSANKKLAGHAAPRLLFNPEMKAYSFRIFPKTLLGCLWMQFAQQIAGEAQYRKCKTCGKWLTISKDKGGVQPNKEFCSAACRQRDHRRKVAEARELKAAGKTVRQIAAHFETKTSTINNWLTKEK